MADPAPEHRRLLVVEDEFMLAHDLVMVPEAYESLRRFEKPFDPQEVVAALLA